MSIFRNILPEDAKEYLDLLRKQSRLREQIIQLSPKQKTFAEIGEEIGVSAERARQIYEEAMTKIRTRLTSKKRDGLLDILSPEPEPTDEELNRILDEMENLDEDYWIEEVEDAD